MGAPVLARDRLSTTPHLSHSRISKYLLCPEQYRLYYVENLRPKYPAGSLIFGKAVHEALADLFQLGSDPVGSFLEHWDEAKELELTYGPRESWEKLRASGEALLLKFLDEELPRLGEAEASERYFELDITSLDLPLVGVIDLVTELDGKRTVVDFKTSASSYGSHEAPLSDQLTAYQLAEPETDQAALCVLVKTKEPRIEWHLAKRSAERLLEFLAKTEYVAIEIETGRFYKHPGLWCKWCDYLPVCMGDKRKIEETLVPLTSKASA